jgi:hypothetical protein
MNIKKILEIAKSEFQQKLTEFCQHGDFSKLTPENAEEFARGLREGLTAAGAEAYKAFLESFDEKEEVVNRDGVVCRFKQISPKYYLTPFGEIKINRRLYQADKGGRSYIPLDEPVCNDGCAGIDFVFSGVDDPRGKLLFVEEVCVISTFCDGNKAHGIRFG